MCVFFLKSVSIGVYLYESIGFLFCLLLSPWTLVYVITSLRHLCASFPKSVSLACVLERSWYFVCRFPRVDVPWFMFLPETEDLCARF